MSVVRLRDPVYSGNVSFYLGELAGAGKKTWTASVDFVGGEVVAVADDGESPLAAVLVCSDEFKKTHRIDSAEAAVPHSNFRAKMLAEIEGRLAGWKRDCVQRDSLLREASLREVESEAAVEDAAQGTDREGGGRTPGELAFRLEFRLAENRWRLSPIKPKARVSSGLLLVFELGRRPKREVSNILLSEGLRVSAAIDRVLSGRADARDLLQWAKAEARRQKTAQIEALLELAGRMDAPAAPKKKGRKKPATAPALITIDAVRKTPPVHLKIPQSRSR